MNNNKRKYALVAGISLLVMAAAAGYSYGFVYNSIVVKGNITETIQNLQSSLHLFIGGITGWGLILFLDLLVAWSLYKLFQDINPNLSLMTAAFRFIYAAFLGIAISYLIVVVYLLGGGVDGADIMFALNSFESFWSLGLIIFGLHLIGLGLLTIKSPDISNIFAWLLLFAGLCYVCVHAAKALLPGLQSQITNVEMILSLPMAIGEIAFAFWLVIRGNKLKIVEV